MSTIASLGGKGGIGKTTTANHLAKVLTDLGFTVRILDTDPQGSSRRWAKTAARSGEALNWEVQGADVTDITLDDRDPRLDEDVDFVIIDTPPGNPAIINAAIEVSDLAIICMTPGPDDFQQASTLLKTIGDNEAAVLITDVDRRTSWWKEPLNYFEKKGLPAFATVIPHLDIYKQSFGTVPTHLEDYTELWNEISSSLPDLVPTRGE